METSAQKDSPPVKIGEVISLRIEGLAAGGDFVGHLGKFAIFVSGAAPSEVAKVEITAVSRNFARGRLISVEQPSPDRIDPRCPNYTDCGGCDLQHLYYPAQLAHKTLLVRESLRHIGGLDEVEVLPALGMEEPWGYRNKAEYFAGRDNEGRIFLGCLRPGTHEAIQIDDCLVQHPRNEEVRRVVMALMNQVAQGAEEKNALVKLITRTSFSSGCAGVTFVTQGKPAFVPALAAALMERLPQVTGVCHAQTRSRMGVHQAPAELVAGEPYLWERLGEWDFRISPDSFFQVNPRQTEILMQVVSDYAGVGEADIVIEGYSGVGTFLLPLAAKARMATGIEESESALDDARANIRKNEIQNTRMYGGKAEQILPRFAERKWHAGVVVLDPPRAGCGKTVLAATTKLHPRALVLVSCDPATLARDLRFVATLGYAVEKIQVVDMFPQTWHTESVALCIPTG